MLLHAENTPDSFALREQVQSDLEKLPDGSLTAWFAETDPATPLAQNELMGFMDIKAVQLPADAEYYLCGPLPFMQAVRSDLISAGIPAKDIQYEVFGPDLWLADFT